MSKENPYRQEPLAVIGFGCRLPGGNTTPRKLWDFLERGDVASRAVPGTRFRLDGHYDGSLKPGTMHQPGSMFLENTDLADFDARFFEVGGTEASSMDPNQRQMLEVVFESLENGGITLNDLDNQPVGCFVASYACDYADMHNRDPEDRPTKNALGVARALLANRLSHFLNIKGPSVTLDTACSGSLQGLDIASRYLQSREIDAAIIAASNLYLSPEHLIGSGGFGTAHSITGLCHTFDMAADGYVKAEGVSSIVVKRLEDAIENRDPIRAVILGTASTSNGRTPGIAGPSATAQALAIRAAYSNAKIQDLNQTTYLECHGTGTQAGDPTEVQAVGSVFAAMRPVDKPLLIGSVKSNIGHSEPAAGNSGLIKAILSLENGFIPGTPTFINPSPKIDFAGNKVKAFRTGIPWPEDAPRRASINSFGVGGSNSHAIIEYPSAAVRDNHVSSYTLAEDDFAIADDESPRPFILVLSANGAGSLRAGMKSLGDHLINPRVKVSLPDLAYTLSERRTKFWHRAFITTQTTEIADIPEGWVVSKKSTQTPTVSFVFTGQGAQWPQMGKDLLQFFPWTREILQELDDVLRNLRHPPSWSLVSELTEPRSPEHLRQAEFSQPLVTALQLCIVAVLERWGVYPKSVVGHSSGEIAAAYTAGLLDRASAITSAFYRGKAAVRHQGEVDGNVGMLAVGLGADATLGFLERYAGQAWIACFNSPSSVTISGKVDALEALREELKAAGHFARRLQVDMAYHTKLMGLIGDDYEDLLNSEKGFNSTGSGALSEVAFFSSVSASKHTAATNAAYWKENMVSAVQFDSALRAMLSDARTAPDFLVEVGPSGALAGPISQVLKSVATAPAGQVAYCAAWKRGARAGKALFDVAGRLWAAGHPVDLALVNEYDATERCIIDLPNYSWDHSAKYWHENAASKDWRFRKYVVHDLLGSKILGTSWYAPTWRSRLNVSNVPFLMDHRIGGNTIMPGAGFIAMALEALYQKHCALRGIDGKSNHLARNDLCYRFRNVRFSKALILEEGKDITILFTLTAISGSKDWHEFRISTSEGEFISEHCSGSIRIHDPIEPADGDDPVLLKSSQPVQLWYKRMRRTGIDFGPAFHKLVEIEAIAGERTSNAVISLEPPEGKYDPQSYYPLHPTALDGCLQTAFPVICGDCTTVTNAPIPALIDDLIINKVPSRLHHGRCRAASEYSGRGRLDQPSSWFANISVYDAESGQLAVQITGMHYAKVDVAPKPDPHTFHSVIWKPDVSFLTQDQVKCVAPQSGSTRLDTILDLIAHKKPSRHVLELNLDEADTSCLWFDKGNSTAKAAYGEYVFGSPNVQSLVHVETLYAHKGNASFHHILIDNPALRLPSDVCFDLVIVKIPDGMPALSKNAAIDALRNFLAKEAYVLVVNVGRGEYKYNTENGFSAGSVNGTQPRGAELVSDVLVSPSAMDDALSNHVSSPALDDEDTDALDNEDTNTSWNLLKMDDVRHATGEPATDNSPVPPLTGLGGDTTTDSPFEAPKDLIIASLSSSYPLKNIRALEAVLVASGWNVIHRSHPFSKPAKGAVVLILDELWRPILTQINNQQWEAIKMLISWGTPLLWVTQGAQGVVSNPDSAMVHGLFRVARQEDPSVRLTTLDVQSSASPATTWAIERVLELLKCDSPMETEYMERDGMLHIQRVMPDNVINDFRRGEDEGFEPTVQKLHNSVQVQLRSERLGTFEGLMWCATETEEALDIGAGNIEVEVVAVGVNFKDVAIIMGIVPDDEYSLGVECAGVVRRLGPGVSKFKVGDRVCMLKSGTYANRVRVAVDRCHMLPAWMTFEEAATIPSVYLCSLYAMYHLGALQKGQSVLIHSAAGGVGIACIELALHRKAEIFVTVGTDEKRQFLKSKYGIPEDRMFSSRTTKFATEIMKATNGHGINVIINSLTGELLDASWRIMADGGNMVEIGKRDILDRNTLSMEPFNRNCSFRAVDMSYSRHIDDQLVASLFDELFILIDAGHLKPIHPITRFGFDKVADALSYIRSGRHLGKIVVSNGDGGQGDVQIPIRPAIRSLRLDPSVSYLVVGGLRGACGTLAVHLALHGARKIIVNSRRGIGDTASARIVASCNAYKCEVVAAQGDITDIAFVRTLFESTCPRIAGIIQGAMVLKDKPLEIMTLDDYHMAMQAKVEGTKNLHQVSEEMRRRNEDQSLDFFTMLASTSGIVGNKGQANYAAANTFLDAFASYRRSLGLRANTVDLGMIEDVGVLADSTLQSRFDTRLWTPINERMLRKILTYSILVQDDKAPLNVSSRTQMIAGISYPLPIDGLELASDPRFAYLFNSRAGENDRTSNLRDAGHSNQTTQAVQRFRLLEKSGADTASLIAACVEVISAQIVKYLQLEMDPEAGRPLMAYGLDSLSAVELRNWIRGKLGVELTTLDITGASSLLALGEKLVMPAVALQENLRHRCSTR
ncbi:hypothetical protein F4802DRAFT_610970 [Xylaria palmicola]|nr:hypothetical protein F4802DRAFT_610970 [Xylaria palmicola]